MSVRLPSLLCRASGGGRITSRIGKLIFRYGRIVQNALESRAKSQLSGVFDFIFSALKIIWFCEKGQLISRNDRFARKLAARLDARYDGSFDKSFFDAYKLASPSRGKVGQRREPEERIISKPLLE
jgi:hypothetical protein